MKRSLRWSAAAALLALIATTVTQGEGDAKAGLITSALVGIVQGDASSTSGTFLIIDKSSGRTMWQAPASGMSVHSDTATGTKTFTYNTSALDTANLSSSGTYEYVFRLDGRSSTSSVKFQSFTQSISGAQFSSQVPNMDLRSRVGEALLQGQFAP